MEQAQWGPKLVATVASQVRRHRKARGISTRALAEQCSELGHPIPRSVLSNLESAYRQTITVPELYVLAAALEVPPADLLLPLGHTDQLEILPGVTVTPPAALEWVSGHRPLPGVRWSGSTSARFYEHGQLVESWEAERQAARTYREMPEERLPAKVAAYGRGQAVDEHERNASRHLAVLARLRERMAGGGLTPPELPVELAELVESQP